LSALLLLAALLPGLAVLFGLIAGKRRGALVARVGVVANLLALAAAVALFVGVWIDQPIAALVEGDKGQALFGLEASRLTSILLILVLGVSAVVQAFSGRYLKGDIQETRFFNGANLLTFATALMVTSITFIGLAVAWTIAGISVILLLAMYSGFPAAREGVRRATRIFLVGDLALWAAVVLATIEWGSLDLRTLGQSGPDLSGAGSVLVVVACLLVVAAMARSAQLPLQSWLPATLAVPTPVSALLHAGVVNAGGILLVRMSPVFGASSEATYLAFFAGAATTVYGTALMLSKADVKGSLAHSTMGQMGFMIMTCGLGAYAAAVFHLFAHGMYKATLFLGSGAAVHSHVRHSKSPPTAPRGRGAIVFSVLVSAIVPAVALAVFAELFYPDRSSGSNALLLFAWATGGLVIYGWMARHRSLSGALSGSVLVSLAGALYVLLLSAVTEFLAPALAGAGDDVVSPWFVLAFFAALLLAGLTTLAGPGSRIAEIRKTIYVLALGAGQVTAPRQRHSSSGRPAASGAGGLVPDSEGARS
jgi:NADH:ubiquinone oxidoreductase subunit 5 (subunit L)/multisubunit Na+/H+ antiporter MnhA subunit